MTHARDIECDDLPFGHPARNGLEQFDIAPNPVEEQQRYSGPLSGLPTHAQRLTIKLQHLCCEAALAVRRTGIDAVFVCRIHRAGLSIMESLDASPIASTARTSETRATR